MTRSQPGSSHTDGGNSALVGNLSLGPALEFERSDATRKLRLVLAELIAIMGQVRLVA